jgi:hypothetical protein
MLFNDVDEDRRSFLGKAAGVMVPPAMVMLLSTSLVSPAIGASGGTTPPDGGHLPGEPGTPTTPGSPGSPSSPPSTPPSTSTPGSPPSEGGGASNPSVGPASAGESFYDGNSVGGQFAGSPYDSLGGGPGPAESLVPAYDQVLPAIGLPPNRSGLSRTAPSPGLTARAIARAGERG